MTYPKCGYKVRVEHDQRNSTSHLSMHNKVAAIFFNLTPEQRKGQTNLFMRRVILDCINVEDNYGAFANMDIPINKVITEYIGEEITRLDG